jgi:ABC-type glycerol-3-phosphate transport system substrate-binding protein
MELWQGIHTEGLAPTGVTQPEVQALFDDGQLAIYIGGPHNLGRLAGYDELPFEYAIAAHPYFAEGEPVTPTGAWSLGVNPNSDNLDAAIELVRFFTLHPDGLGAWLDPRSQHPIPAAVDSIPAYLGQDRFQQEFGGTSVAELTEYELSNTAVGRPRSAGYVIFEEIVGRALEDIRNGQPIADTLQRAEEDLVDAFARR